MWDLSKHHLRFSLGDCFHSVHRSQTDPVDSLSFIGYWLCFMAVSSVLRVFAQLCCSVARLWDAYPNMLMELCHCSSWGCQARPQARLWKRNGKEYVLWVCHLKKICTTGVYSAVGLREFGQFIFVLYSSTLESKRNNDSGCKPPTFSFILSVLTIKCSELWRLCSSSYTETS